MESNAVSETQPTVEIKQKTAFIGKVIKVSLAGAVIDIGSDKPAVLHISQLPLVDNEPVKRVEEVLEPGKEVEVWVRRVKDDHVELTMIKPLDLEWREIKKGMTVKGKVVRLEKFGAFVDIGAERPGLVHISEMAHGYIREPGDLVKEGEEIEAQVLEVSRKKKQIKLSMKALEPEPVKVVAEETGEAKGKGRRKKGRKAEQEMDVQMEEEAKEPDPTYMEIALRAAMEKADRSKHQRDRNKKAKSQSDERDELLSRTLSNKVSS
jgi:ribosomal protein S1